MTELGGFPFVVFPCMSRPQAAQFRPGDTGDDRYRDLPSPSGGKSAAAMSARFPSRQQVTGRHAWRKA